ncbi:MAG: hypothetical protein QOK39_2674 [Acidimicrobiaceae bacterium]|jgi:hypothetical protein|nr:hypothetical protein [Acidimicrobiaceae bacterium]
MAGSRTAPPPPGLAVERARPNGPALTATERRWDELAMLANTIADSGLVTKGMKDQPRAVMAGLILCDAIGVDPRTMIGSIDLIEGKLEPRAQMYLAASHVHGWETRWGQLKAKYICDGDPSHVSWELGDGTETVADCRCGALRWAADEPPKVFGREPDEYLASLCGKPWDAPDSSWEVYTFTVEMAEKAHLLDEWVEHWVDTGETWEDSGKPKKSLEKFVLGRPEVDIPEWAANEIRLGRAKHNNQWHNWRRDMLSARCSKWFVKRAVPSAMFGRQAIAPYMAHAPADVVAFVDGTDDDSDAVDGEFVAGSPAGPATRPGPYRPQSGAGPAEQPASALERKALRLALDGLGPRQTARVRDLCKAADPPVPFLDGTFFSAAHAVLMAELIAEARDTITEAPVPAPAASETTCAAPTAQGPPEPVSQPRRANADPGRPFTDD